MKGFSIIELILIMALISILMYFTLPISVDFYRTTNFYDTSENIAEVLKRARQKAVYCEYDSDFTVTFYENRYILTASNNGEYSEEFLLDPEININGISQITFYKQTGKPSAYGNLTVSCRDIQQTININPQGIVILHNG